MLQVDATELPPWVCNEHLAELPGDILEVCACAIGICGRGPSPGFSPGDVIASPHPAVGVNFGQQDGFLLFQVTDEQDALNDWHGVEVGLELFECLSIHG